MLAIAGVTRGTRAWIELPFFNFQPSELGKVLLIVALSAFLVDRMRRMGRDTTARIMVLGLIPTMLVIAEPDLGSALVYVAGTMAAAVRGRRAVAALRGARRRCSRSRSRSCWWRPRWRAWRCSSRTRSTA